jgi:hypothetical protein
MWEIGQHVFERWWWAFEAAIVELSNVMRRQRGRERLKLASTD